LECGRPLPLCFEMRELDQRIHGGFANLSHTKGQR
jgi:hypothetical protein